jgi:exoribonuclease R
VVRHEIAGAPLDYAAVRSELVVPGDFAFDVLADAQRAAEQVGLPDEDATDIELVTLDPSGSRDLDQAVHIAPDGDGYLVSYAIADVAAFVSPGSPLDKEAWRRGETLYFPDMRVSLHPTLLSEGAASLLPDQVRPAALWRIALDSDGTVTSVDIRRARVRSRAQLDYSTTQAALDDGRMREPLALLEAVGTTRLALARERHAINLDLPEQDVQRAGSGWRLASRSVLPVERYNAEISLLIGMCAAQLMLDGGIGVLRTLPDPDEHTVHSLRHAAQALGVAWPDNALPGDVLASLDRTNPHHVVLIDQARALLRGAGYTAFDGAVPQQRGHAGIGAPYAHVTAPLRRLVDRYTTEICLALCGRRPVPVWVKRSLTPLPDAMRDAEHRGHEAERAVVDATEAWLLQDRVGETFDVMVLDAERHSATIALADPAVRARCVGDDLPAGATIRARLVTADVATRTVQFAVGTAGSDGTRDAHGDRIAETE